MRYLKAERVARDNRVPVVRYNPPWNTHGLISSYPLDLERK